MWQRLQTLWLVLAALACVACLCLPVGIFADERGETVGTLYNLWVHIPAPTLLSEGPQLATEGTHQFTPWALFAILVLTASLQCLDICLFKHRLVQSRLALFCALLLVAWYAVYGLFIWMLGARYDASFQPPPWAAFPAISCIFSYLAFRLILKDEMLVRSLDRLR